MPLGLAGPLTIFAYLSSQNAHKAKPSDSLGTTSQSNSVMRAQIVLDHVRMGKRQWFWNLMEVEQLYLVVRGLDDHSLRHWHGVT